MGLAVAGAAMLAASGSARAQNWTGLYLGANAGAGITDSHVSNTVCTGPVTACFWASGFGDRVNAVGSGDLRDTVFTGGGQIGYNWQTSVWVLGVEADFNSLRTSVTRTASTTYSAAGSSGITFTDTISASYLATARGRLGYAMGNLLVYFTGGAAFANLKHSHFAGEFGFGPRPPCVPPVLGENMCDHGGSSSTRTGWTLGGGGEWMLGGNWSIKGEYLYVDFGKVSGTTTWFSSDGTVSTVGGVPQSIAHSADFALHVVRAGVNYKF